MASTIDPKDWFLEGVPYTDGNLATPLIDGSTYFKELKRTIETLGNSPYLLISGWRLNPNTLIDPINGQSIQDLISRSTTNNGLRTRSMLWYVPGSIGDFSAGHGSENVAFTEFITAQGGEAILDNRLPNGRFASHHQKYIVAGSASGNAAFVGGIDVAPDRWDENDHNSSEHREPELFAGWHDVQVKLEGPVVSEIWSCFQERWNDRRVPHNFPAVGNRVPTRLNDGQRPNISSSGGTHSIQILKTYACKSNAGDGTESAYPFAPGGLYTYEDGLKKAIENAKHYVYLEDQYFWPCAVVDALADAARRGVKIIVVLAREFDVPALQPYQNFLRDTAIEKLKAAADSENRVFVYHLEQSQVNPATQEREQIYVHSKTLIIDDRYLVIGSANINRRSMTTDSELGVAIVDTNAVLSTLNGQDEMVSALALFYRKKLWSEHLRSQIKDDLLDTIGLPADLPTVNAPVSHHVKELWPKRLRSQVQVDPFDANGLPAGFPTGNELVGHVRRYDVAQPRFCNPNIVPFGVMNTQTRC